MSIKQFARRAFLSGLGRFAVHVPVDRGPIIWRDVVGMARLVEARRLTRRGGDYGVARQCIEPVLENRGLGSRAWTVFAELLLTLGQADEALAAARRATAVAPVEFEAVNLHRRLAARSGDLREARELLERFLEVQPRNSKHLNAALGAFVVENDVELLELYRCALQAWGLGRYVEKAEQALAEVRVSVAYAAGAETFDRAVKQVVTEYDQPARIVLRALLRREAWRDLVAFLDVYVPYALEEKSTASGTESEPAFVARMLAAKRAANRAFAAGRTTAAISIARRILVVLPDDRRAREVLEQGSDQLSVVASGWPRPPVLLTPYDPRPDAVVSVLAQSLPVTSGGYAARSHGVLTGLAARGWDVRAVTRLGFPYDWWRGHDDRGVTSLDLVDGIPYHRLYDEGVRDYPQYPLESYIGRYAERLSQHAMEHQASLIHAASFYVNGLAAGRAARGLGIPLIYEMRGLEDLMRVARDPDFEHSERHEFLTMIENLVCRDADIVFVITEALRREMVDRGVDGERLVVLPNGVDVDRFRPRERDTALASELGVNDKNVIGYAGGLIHYEGLELLLHAAATLKQGRDDFVIVVVGDGPSEQELRALAERLGLVDRVTFTGRVPHAEVARYISLFDITPFPRLPLRVCELISPMKPFEAMAAGKAVVASSVSALTEIVDDGRTGLVFEKGSADDLARVLAELLDFPERRTMLGHAAREWVVKKRDWSHVVSIVDDTYRRLLENATKERRDKHQTLRLR
jgi:glycosyltransferase involved in cell wall biosynthesis/tetratricopeptide (TPR) repeat protein